MRPTKRAFAFLAGLRRTGAAKLLACLALLAIPAAQAVVTWHEMTVRHVVCADHGELTHVVITGRGAETATDAPSTRSPGFGVARQSPLQAEGHEHCALALVVHNGHQTQPSPTAVPNRPPPPVVQTAAKVGSPRGRTIVLASAPKTSPPRS